MENQQVTQLRSETDPRKPAAYFFFFLLPFLLFLLFFLIIRKSPLDFHLVFSDELDYWAETATLIKRGLFSPNAGYFGYSFDNHARFLYFGAHGFFSLIPYALFSFFVPRAQVTVLALNALFMGLSLSTAYYVIGSFRKTLAIALPIFGFYPFYLYYQTGMVEPLFYAGSIILAVLCVKSFMSGPRQRSLLKLYFWIVILFSLFRLSNLVLLIPAFFVEIGSLKRKVLLLIIKYGAVSVVVVLLSIVFAATYPWGFLGELGYSTNKLGLVFAHTVSNIKLLFDLKAGYALELLPRLLSISWLVFLCIVYIATKKHHTYKTNYFLLSQILAMLALLLINVTLYDVGSFRDLRVLSPVLVFSMIASFLSGRGNFFAKPALTLTVIFLLVSTFVVVRERTLVWDLFIARRYEVGHPPAILQAVRYDPDAKTRWENTAYLDLQAYGSLNWKNYDPGIGIMVLGPEDMATLKVTGSDSLLKAKYIISLEPIQISGYELTKTEQNTNLYFRR
jgi:hypothetical protein